MEHDRAVMFELLTAVALAVLVVRVEREPRRVGNAVWLGLTVVFLGLSVVSAEGPGREVGRLVVFVLLLVALVLPVALIANGIVMWRRESHRLANLLSLAAGVGIVGLAVLALVAVFSRNVWVGAAVASVLLVCAYVTFLFGYLLAYSVFYALLGRRRGVEAVVVLGAGLRGDQVPPLLASRLDRAERLYQRERGSGSGPLVVVSGGQGPDETVPEAVAMRDYLVRRGLPEDDVVLEDQATSTEENLRLGTALIDAHGRGGRIVAVTNDYHVFRTAVIARRLSLELDVVGARTAPYFLPSALLREFTALLVHYPRANLAAGAVLALAPWLLVLMAG